MEKPIFEKVAQIGIVVRDMERSVKMYWDRFGIGPWYIYTVDATNSTNDYGTRMAMARAGDMEWELLQPLDDRGIYAEFLREHGEGLHHIGFEVDSFEQTLEACRGQGIELLASGTMSGIWKGMRFAYLDTRDTLSIISEIWSTPEGLDSYPPPEAVYPDREHASGREGT